MNANIGKLNSGKCYVYLNGYRSEPFWGTEAECEAEIIRHGVADPIPVFLEGVDLTTSTKPMAVVAKTARLPLREYVMTFKAADGSEDGTSGYVENVFARDRNEAMRKGRDIVRENAGPYGPKIRISARLT